MNKRWWWGRSASIDLHGCDHTLVSDSKAIHNYIEKLVKLLNMKKVGPMRIKRFGHAELRGYSVMQFIETSTIVGHFDESANRAFLDIFSCKRYNPSKAAEFSKHYFKAKDCSINLVNTILKPKIVP